MSGADRAQSPTAPFNYDAWNNVTEGLYILYYRRAEVGQRYMSV